MTKNLVCDYYQTDALIIGGGLSGLMAARSIILPENKNISVLTTGCGSSSYIHGINIPLLEKDSPACFINDTIKSGHNQGDEILVKELCNDSVSLIPLFEEMGISLDRESDNYALLHSLGSSWPRVVSAGNSTGIVIMNKIKDELTIRRNIKIHNTVRALRLMVTEGTVQGALAYDTEKKSLVFIETNVIILASGGFSGVFPFSTNTSDISGDGIAMAYEAGASLTDLEFVQFEPCAAVHPDHIRGEILLTTMFYEGAVLRNIHGERFMNRHSPSGERVNKDILSQLMYQEIKSGKGTAHGGIFFDATGMDAQKLNDKYPMYVKRYTDCGIDITRELVEVAPAPHTSLGGVVISQDCVTSIEGLYACGEITGGIHGGNRIGGNASLETIVFGRRAGKAVSRYLLKENNKNRSQLSEKTWSSWVESIVYPETLNTQNSINSKQMDVIRTQMEDKLEAALNAVRCKEELESAIAEFESAYNMIQNSFIYSTSDELFTKLRLNNDLCVAYLLAMTALERNESIGCHVRSDSGTNIAERYRIQVNKKSDGIAVKKIALDTFRRSIDEKSNC